MLTQFKFTLSTHGRGFINITDKVAELLAETNIETGLCHVFLHHTSASLILCENADPSVQEDLETFFAKMIPDQASLYAHNVEGSDDMPAHIRSILTQTFLMVPVTNSQLALGTWQGIYLWEHRIKPHQRHLTITIYGEIV